jgi:TRAP-type C4-dicarboxylate transport system substrate-binding protein
MFKQTNRRQALLTGLGLGLASFWPPRISSAQTTVWKYYAFTAARNPATQLLFDFVKDAKELTKGQLDIRVYPQGELPYQPSDAASITSKHLVDLANAEVSYLAGEVPVSPLMSMPLMIGTKDDAYKAGEIFIPYLDKVLQEKYNARILWWYAWPPRKIIGQGQAPKSLADLHGKKIRFPGPIGAEFLVRLGMVPVNINPGDVPTALQRGTLDGTSGAYVFLDGTKWYELCHWGYEIETGGVLNLTLVNKESYEKVASEVKDVLQNLARKYTSKGTELGYRLEDQSRAKFEKAGIKFVQPSAADLEQAREKITPFWTEWASSKGPEAAEVLKRIRQGINK